MIIYQENTDLPRKSEISFIHSDNKFIFYNGEEAFMNFIEKDNEIILKVVCEDGFVLFFRSRQ